MRLSALGGGRGLSSNTIAIVLQKEKRKTKHTDTIWSANAKNVVDFPFNAPNKSKRVTIAEAECDKHRGNESAVMSLVTEMSTVVFSH